MFLGIISLYHKIILKTINILLFCIFSSIIIYGIMTLSNDNNDNGGK